jgi:hypothetical protein
MTPTIRFLLYFVLSAVVSIALLYDNQVQLFYIYTAVSGALLTQRLTDIIK